MGEKMSPSESQETPWAFVAVNLERVRLVKNQLKAYGVTSRRHVATILSVLDRHGLFHEVITPKLKESRKEIGQRAKRSAAELRRRITKIRNGKELPANSQEADLAERWEQPGKDRMRLEELRVLSETFQINRGGRITSRYASRKSRKSSPQGRRSDPEITHALQILDRYLGEKYPQPIRHPRRRVRARSHSSSLRKKGSMTTNRRRECLGDVLRLAMNEPDPRQLVLDRVRSRLKDAEKKTPLDNFDYFDAIGLTLKANKNRQKMFLKCMSILASPKTSAKKKKTAEDTLQKLFSFN